MILHICGRDEWPPPGGSYRAGSLDTEGFIHCSDFGTVHLPASLRFRGRDDLVLLVIDPDRLDVPLRWEQAAGDLPADNLPWFPHVFGPIPEKAVVAVHEFPARPDGTFELPAALAEHRS